MNKPIGENGCPYCAKGWNCSHEFIFTQDGYLIEGYGEAIYEFLVKNVQDRFNNIWLKASVDIRWETPWVNELWISAGEFTAPEDSIFYR